MAELIDRELVCVDHLRPGEILPNRVAVRSVDLLAQNVPVELVQQEVEAELERRPVLLQEIHVAQELDVAQHAGRELGEEIDPLTTVGVRYYRETMIPYWDPETGYRLDLNGAVGMPLWGESSFPPASRRAHPRIELSGVRNS